MDIKKRFNTYRRYCISYCICFLMYVFFFFSGKPYFVTLKVILLFVAFFIALLAMKLTLADKQKKIFYLWFASALVSATLVIWEVLK